MEWQLGHPDLAMHRVDNAISLARRQNHPYNLAFALYISSSVPLLRGDLSLVVEANDEVAKLSARFGFPLWSALCKMRGASIRARMGETDGTVDVIKEALAELAVMNFYSGISGALISLCEAQWVMGAIEDARLTIEKALVINAAARLYRPEVLRIHGELQLASDFGDAGLGLAQRDFREAIELAQKMGAKSWELRATTSLARLLAKQGRSDEARERLAAIYNRFTEGFDTVDLKDAKALLDELSR